MSKISIACDQGSLKSGSAVTVAFVIQPASFFYITPGGQVDVKGLILMPNIHKVNFGCVDTYQTPQNVLKTAF